MCILDMIFLRGVPSMGAMLKDKTELLLFEGPHSVLYLDTVIGM